MFKNTLLSATKKIPNQLEFHLLAQFMWWWLVVVCSQTLIQILTQLANKLMQHLKLRPGVDHCVYFLGAVHYTMLQVEAGADINTRWRDGRVGI